MCCCNGLARRGVPIQLTLTTMMNVFAAVVLKTNDYDKAVTGVGRKEAGRYCFATDFVLKE